MTSHEERNAAEPFQRQSRRYRTVKEWKAELRAEPIIYPQPHGQGGTLLKYMCPFTHTLIETGLPIPGAVLDGDDESPDARKDYGRFRDVCCLYTWALLEKTEHRMTPDLYDRITCYCQRVLRDDNVPTTPSPKLLRSRGGDWTVRDWEAQYQSRAFNFPWTLDRHLRASDELLHRKRTANPPAVRKMDAAIDILAKHNADALDDAVHEASQLTEQLAPLLAPGPSVPEFSVAAGSSSFSSSSSSKPVAPAKKRKTISIDAMSADAAPAKVSKPKKPKASPMNVDFNSFLSELTEGSAPKKPAAKKAASAVAVANGVVSSAPAAKKKKAAAADEPALAKARSVFVADLATQQAAPAVKKAAAKTKKAASAPAAAATSSSSSNLARPGLPTAKHKLVVKAKGKSTEVDSSNLFADLGKLLYSDGFAPTGVHSVGFFVLDHKGVLTLTNASGAFKTIVPQ